MEEAKYFELIIKQLEPAAKLTDSSVNKQALIDKINWLIANDFSRLISILRRMDVSEKKLKMLLQHNKDQDAATIILGLMIDRHIEKVKTKEGFKKNDDIPEDEKW